MSATTLCFANIKGGVGKTTLAVNLAHALALDHQARVLVVDMDPQLNASTTLLGIEAFERYRKTHRSIYNFFDTAPDQLLGIEGGRAVQPSQVKPVDTGKGFDLILGALRLAYLELRSIEGHPLPITGLRDGLLACGAKDRYDYIIIDTPPSPSHYLVTSLIAADFFVAPSRADFMSIQGLALFQRIYETLRQHPAFPITAEPLGVILTLVQNDRQENDGRTALQDIIAASASSPDPFESQIDPRFFRPFDGKLRSNVEVPRYQERQKLIREMPKCTRAGTLRNHLTQLANELRYRCLEQRAAYV